MLNVSESGSGVPLVLLHGWGLHSGVWGACLSELNKSFHCYAVDMLGHGESILKEQQRFDLPTMSKSLHEIIHSINSDEIVLLGWSLGGLIAMDYVNRYPKDIDKLILVTANASFCKKEDWPHAMDESVLNNFAEQLELDYKKTVDKFMALQMFGADDYKQSLKTLKKNMASRPMPPADVLRSGLNVLKETDCRSYLKSIEQAVLMISGEHDRLMPFQAASDMKNLIRNSQHQMIKGAGHAPFISHIEKFTEAIRNFSKE